MFDAIVLHLGIHLSPESPQGPATARTPGVWARAKVRCIRGQVPLPLSSMVSSGLLKDITPCPQFLGKRQESAHLVAFLIAEVQCLAALLWRWRGDAWDVVELVVRNALPDEVLDGRRDLLSGLRRRPNSPLEIQVYLECAVQWPDPCEKQGSKIGQ